MEYFTKDELMTIKEALELGIKQDGAIRWPQAEKLLARIESMLKP